MVMPPVYHPFFLVTEHNHREVVYSPLLLKDGQYQIDFERFRADVKGCKMLILSNPHNPGGRVWTREELAEIAEICFDNQVLVISDEIHADLTLPGYTHPTFALVSEKARRNSLVFMSPSKAFNMPGLASSYCIIEDEAIRHRFQTYMEASEFSEGHLFAYLGVAAAYSNGTEWLDQALEYIQENIDFTDEYLKTHIPAIRMIRPQASYLIFLDCRGMGVSQKELVDFFVDGAHLALNDGAMFGKEGEGFMRLNVACPRSVLRQALDQIKEAYELKHDTIANLWNLYKKTFRMKKNSFETQILHTPFEKEDAYHSLSMPVYHTAAYEFETAEEMEAAFCGQKARACLFTHNKSYGTVL